MRYLLVTLGSWGDLHPFLAVARGLVRAGHDVELMANAPYQATVEAEGVCFSAACSERDHERTAHHPELWHPVRGFGILWRHLAVPAIEPVRQRVLSWASQAPGAPGHVLASPLAVGARLATASGLSGVALCSVYTAPANLRPLDNPMFLGPARIPWWVPTPLRRALWWGLDRWKLEPLARELIEGRCRDAGLPAPVGSVFGKWIHSPAGGVALFPEMFGPADAPRGCAAIQHGDFPRFRSAGDALPEVVTAFLQAGEAPVVLFPGSHPGPEGRRLVRLTLQACRALGLRAIVLARAQELSPGDEAPDEDALFVRHAPLAALLPRARAFVHHGGIGSCAEGMAAGLPQIIMPFAYDQFDNAARVRRLHAGSVVDSTSPNAAMSLLSALDKAARQRGGQAGDWVSPENAVGRCLDAIWRWETQLS